MIEIKIVATCLTNGKSGSVIENFKSRDVAKDWLEKYLVSLDTELPKKFIAAEKRFLKGTSEGIKVFYNPRKGIRIYLWIKISEEIVLL